MIKIFPKERISQAENVIFAKWKTDSVSTKQFVGMRENAFVFVLKGKKSFLKMENLLQLVKMNCSF